MEGEVFERVVLGPDGQVVGGGVGRDALGDGPGGEDAVAFQAQVPVEGAGVVLLDDEGVAAARLGRLGGDGFGGSLGVAFAPVLLKFVNHRPLLPGSSRMHERTRADFWEDDPSQSIPLT